ncbi:hypothetical protein Psch_03454 [Pelotomaculum schinkii]|uniref:TrbL/VirB6 plasmid conjugal transfer protein n=1 Tax=Pelotomaculum schinkii TaxID=78350 RepID=A0A4Y7R7H1_9FIRM|nr:hypothetical protein Psch_03454 [Pelotomaculum schinkii]
MQTLISLLLVLVALLTAPEPAFCESVGPPTQDDLSTPVGVVFFDLNGSAAAERNEQIQNQEMPLENAPYISKDDLLANVTEPSWLNVPMSRLRFDTAEDHGVGVFARVTGKNVGGVLASFADGLFQLSSMSVNWGIEIIYLAFRTNWIAAFASQVTAPTLALWQSLFGLGMGNSSLFGLCMMVLFGYLLYYLARMQLMQIVKTTGVTILILVLAFVYFANAGRVLLSVSNTADALSGFVLSAVGGAFSSQPDQTGQSGFDSMLQSFGNSMWCGLVANTWAALEFGTTKPQDLILTDAEYQRMQSNSTISENSFDPNSSPPKQINPFTAGWIKPGSRIDQIVLSYSVNNVARGEIVNVLADQSVDHGRHAIARENLLPYNKIKCIVFSFLFWLPATAFLIFSVVIGGSMILAQFTLLGLALLLPIIFLVALVPEVGWNFGYKAVRMAVAALSTKIVYGIFLSVIVLIINFVFWLTS